MGKKARKRNRAARQAGGPLLVTWKGESYRVADKFGIMPMMRFAKVAESGIDANEMVAGVAMYDLLEQCLTPQDWVRFERHATAIRADGDEVMELVKATYQALSGRPTVRPSDSLDGLPSTAASSEAASSSPVTPVLRVIDSIPAGRPDLKLAVWQSAQEQQAV